MTIDQQLRTERGSFSSLRQHEIRFPDTSQILDQDEEWCEVRQGGRWRRFRFHDYDQLYRVPGLYEAIFYRRLKCCSPSRVVGLLDDVLSDEDVSAEELTGLDIGAGNGMVGQELRGLGLNSVIGLDIIPEAAEATERDRPDVYEDYLVADLTDLDETEEERLRQSEPNCLTSVAALGYGDIPPEAFITALDLLDTPGWLAFNIKEDFIRERDTTGFCRLVRQLARDEVIQMQAYRRYRHRYTIDGRSLHYVAMVATKRRDVPDGLIA